MGKKADLRAAEAREEARQLLILGMTAAAAEESLPAPCKSLANFLAAYYADKLYEVDEIVSLEEIPVEPKSKAKPK